MKKGADILRAFFVARSLRGFLAVAKEAYQLSEAREGFCGASGRAFSATPSRARNFAD
jgi:hypothetical protein